MIEKDKSESSIFHNEDDEICAAFIRLYKVVKRIRAPDGCPWDREQTHKSLRPYIIEEVYEFLEGVDNNDCEIMKEELGDVLLQVLLHAEIARESDRFKLLDTINTITEKLIRRHPHVFKDTIVINSEEVLRNWEAIKKEERLENNKNKTNENISLLAGIPQSMPALLVAQRMQEKAARIGFDWGNIVDVWDKVKEEISELEKLLDSKNVDRIEDELGDAFFALTNLARFFNLHSEMALRRTNNKFYNRFTYVERKIDEEKIENPTLEQMDVFWDEAKNLGK